jgi:hypothetical protein
MSYPISTPQYVYGDHGRISVPLGYVYGKKDRTVGGKSMVNNTEQHNFKEFDHLSIPLGLFVFNEKKHGFEMPCNRETYTSENTSIDAISDELYNRIFEKILDEKPVMVENNYGNNYTNRGKKTRKNKK